MPDDFYGFTRETTKSASSTVNATSRQQQANEIETIKSAVRLLEQKVQDLTKAVDQLTIDFYRKQ